MTADLSALLFDERCAGHRRCKGGARHQRRAGRDRRISTEVGEDDRVVALSDRAAAIVKALLLESASARHRRIAYGAAAFAIVLAWIVDARGPIVFAVDDAYITAHNADALASGSDPNYDVPGLTGATSPLHTALTALFALVAPGATAVYIVMWLGALAYVLGVLRLAFACRASIGQAVLLAIAAIAVAEVPHQLMNGLETGWALAAIVWTLALATEGLPRARITAALCGVLPLLRPELVVVSVLVLALQAWRRWTAGQPRAAALRAIAIDTAIAAAVVAPFVIALWATTGSPVPVTIAAKRAFYAEVCLPEPIRRARVINSVRDMVGLLGALSAAIILLVTTRLGRAGLAFIVVLLAAYYSQFPSALAHHQHRYMYPIVPFLVFGVASCLRDRARARCAGPPVRSWSRRHCCPVSWRRPRGAATRASTRPGPTSSQRSRRTHAITSRPPRRSSCTTPATSHTRPIIASSTWSGSRPRRAPRRTRAGRCRPAGGTAVRRSRDRARVAGRVT